MCSLQTILDAVVGKITKLVFDSVVRHGGFVFQYKKYLKNLEVEMEKLEEQRSKINEKVDEAINRGDEVDGPVLNWLVLVDKEVEEFSKDHKTNKENMQCFIFSCPDYISRYQMSKEAENKIDKVKTLTQNGNFSEVAHLMPPPEELQFSSSANYANFESRKFVFNNIMEALKDSNVKMIGVFGPGGVGKTTMVEEVGKQVKNGGFFDEVVVAVVSQDVNVEQIQGQLADRLSLELKGETKVGKANKLWNRLKNGKKNLIILDDIWQALDLGTIGIPVSDGNKGCKVVMTSRKRDVLENMQIDREIEIQILKEPEAWVLLKKKVGNSIESSELRAIADAVCKELQGLPVAILAVGAALKGKEKYAWENALEKLKKSMLKKIEGIDPRLYTSLKLSYDLLESMDAKSCFLLCCLFPEDVEISIDDLVRHCIARRLLDQKPDTLKKARDTVRTVVHTLKSCSLLLDGSNEYVVKMHDVIRDVAISIAEDENTFLVKHGDGVQEWLEKSTYESSSAISLRSKTILEFPNELGCPRLHTLLLEYSNPLAIIPDMFFSGMENLTVLNLNKIHMLCLPSSLANLVSLRMLYLNYCELKDITILKNLKNKLEILSLRDSNIEVLPSEIGQLTRLRLLDLGDCNKLTEIPQGVLSNLSRLEELYMLDGFDLWDPTTCNKERSNVSFDQWEATTCNKERSNVSLDELSKLAQLTTLEICIPNLMLVPKDLCFEKLIRFKISMGDSFKINEDCSRIFKFKGVSLRDEFNVLLERAEVLDLNNLKGLRKMHHDRGGEGFLMQSYRLDTSRSFNKLTELTIRDCQLKYLFSPSCARGLLQLQKLNVQNCVIMEEIVGIEGEKDKEELTSQVINFSQLKRMELTNLPKLISFYPKMEKATTSDGNSSTQSLFNEKVDFPLLEHLEIDKLPNITEIWDKQLLTVPQKESNSFCQLQFIGVSNCENMMNVVRSNDDIITFPQLKYLRLFSLKNLKSFCSWPTRSETQPLFNHQVVFPALERLIIFDLPSMTVIQDGDFLSVKERELKSFCQLTSMVVSNCEKMVNVVPSNMVPQLQNLKQLQVSNCLKMEAIVLESTKEKKATNDDIILFPQLTTLQLDSLINLKSFYSSPTRSKAQQPLFNHQVDFPLLEDLKIGMLPNITEIWDKQLLTVPQKESNYFCQLQFMGVFNCENMMNVIRSNDDIITFPRLKDLHLGNLKNLKSFCNWTTRSETQPLFNHQVDFPLLEDLYIDKLPNITEIWNKQLLTVPQKDVAFPKLKELHLLNCVNSGEIHLWNVLVSEISLKVLRVEKCDQESTVVSLRLVQRLQYLDKLIVRNCGGVTEVFQLEELNVGGREGQHQHGRPLTEVRMMELDRLPQLTCLWNKDPRGILGLQSLQYLVIKKCSLLRNLLTCSTAKALQQLKVLYLESCTLMEQVIATDEEGHKEEATDDDDEIEFLKLEWLILKDLSNLNSFCNAENCNFNFPSLKRVVLKRCPKMHTFTSGQVRMSQVLVSTRGNEDIQTEDLNKYLTEQPLLKGEESATMDENDYSRGRENRYSNLLRLRE